MERVNRITCAGFVVLGIATAVAVDGGAGAMLAAAGPLLCPPLTDDEIRAKRERLQQAAKQKINTMGSRYVCHKKNYIKRGDKS